MSTSHFSTPFNLGETPKQKHLRDYGTEAGFEGFKVSASYPVRLQTEPTGPGSETVIVSKIDTYGAVDED